MSLQAGVLQRPAYGRSTGLGSSRAGTEERTVRERETAIGDNTASEPWTVLSQKTVGMLAQ